MKGHHPDPLVDAFSRIQAPDDLSAILNAAHKQAHAASCAETEIGRLGGSSSSAFPMSSSSRGVQKTTPPRTVFTESNTDVTVRRSLQRPTSAASSNGGGTPLEQTAGAPRGPSHSIHPSCAGTPMSGLHDNLVLEDLGATEDLLFDDVPPDHCSEGGEACVAARLVQQFTTIAAAGLAADQECRARDAIASYSKCRELAKKLRSCGQARLFLMHGAGGPCRSSRG